MTNFDDDDFYPHSDGRPFDSDCHCDVMASLRHRLKERYSREADVYVSGWLFIYFERGNRKRSIAPDSFLVRGVPKRDRRHFLVWKEQATPSVVIEVTSKRTRKEDWNTKLPIYRDVIRVPEVFFFDPRREYLNPPFLGFRLSGTEYVPLPMTPVQGIWSKQLELELRPDGVHLQLIDPNASDPSPTLAELHAETLRLQAEIAALQNQVPNS